MLKGQILHIGYYSSTLSQQSLEMLKMLQAASLSRCLEVQVAPASEFAAAVIENLMCQRKRTLFNIHVTLNLDGIKIKSLPFKFRENVTVKLNEPSF